MGEASYTLEVSSPGVNRPLTEPKHWRRAVGRVVSAPLLPQPGTSAGAPAAAVTGRVAGADSSGVRIDVDGTSREFVYSELGPGRIQIEFAPLDGYAADGADEEGPDGY
jgi:ribosome maturation factor RimP